jgi:RimJ/RimL family protein N-acetyltransferase
MRIVRAAEGDIGLISSIERLEGYDSLVGRSTAEEHLARMGRPDVVYWLLDKGGPERDVAGFAIVTGFNDRHSGPYLLRIAVSQPGIGLGRRFVPLLLDWVFDELQAPRFWLDVFAHNLRARRTYAACGFVEEGVLRSSYAMPDGTRADRVVMAILRDERRRGSQ